MRIVVDVPSVRQIYVTTGDEPVWVALREEAARTGSSMSAIVNEVLRRRLARQESRRRSP